MGWTGSQGFIKDGNKNRLREQDIHRIVDVFNRQAELPRYSRRVPLAEIDANDFNLNLPRYIDSSAPEDLQDIEAHLLGGMPQRDIDGLDAYWQVLPAVRSALFADAGRPGYSRLRVAAGEIKATIFGHPEFAAFKTSVGERFARWQLEATPLLKGFDRGGRPKALIDTLSEALLARFAGAPLIDPYDVYQRLMDYWALTLQDDAWMIASDGWQALQDGKPNTDLIPPALVVARYFAKQQAAIQQLEAEREAIARLLEDLDEEQGGLGDDEGGLLADAKTDKGKLTAKSVKDRLKLILGDKQAGDERQALEACLGLFEQEAAAAKKLKDAQKALDARVMAQYSQLPPAEVKALVVDDKWLAALAASVQGELDRVSQALTGRVRQLAERYATPMQALELEVDLLAIQVGKHLTSMGFAR